MQHSSVTHGNLDFCAFGMKDPVSKKFYKKGTSLLHNFEEGTLDPIFEQCPSTAAKKVHEHESCEGHAKGHGSRTKLSQIYPYKFCEQLADLLGVHLGSRILDNASLVVNDILETTFTNDELGSAHGYFSETLYSTSHAECGVTAPGQDTLLNTSLATLPVEDYATKQLMASVNSLAKGKELLSHLEGYDTWTAKLTSLASQVRGKIYTPEHVY